MKAFSFFVCLFIFTASVSVLYAAAEDDYDAGLQYYNHSAFDIAEGYFRKAVSEKNDYWEAYEMLAYTYFKENNLKDSARAAHESLAIHPDNENLKKFVADSLKHDDVGEAPTESKNVSNWTASVTEKPKAVKCDSFYFNVGIASPVNPYVFESQQRSGLNIGAGYGFGLSNTLQFVFDFHYDDMPLNQSNFVNPFTKSTVSGGDFSVCTLLVNLKAKFIVEDNSVVPYIIGGLGPILASQGSITGNGYNLPASSAVYFGLRLGLGIDFRLSPEASIYLESNGIAFFTGSGSNNVLGYNSARLGGKINIF